MKAKISVIIPIYNVEKYLERCLDSVINQTLQDIEIICVNDGSQDNSLNIVKRYALKDKRIIIVSQEYKGVSAARNTGMSIATGEYIGFVDSDDWIDKDFYERLYYSANSHNADIACASAVRNYSSGRTRKKVLISTEQTITSVRKKYEATNTPRMCYVWNKIYRRTAILNRDIKFVEGVYFEDVGFIIRALYYLRTLVTVPGVFYHYWVNVESITRQMTDKKQQDLIAARADFIQFSKEHNIPCDERYYLKHKTVYKLFGIPLMKVYEWETIKKYYLFALFPVFEKRVSL